MMWHPLLPTLRSCEKSRKTLSTPFSPANESDQSVYPNQWAITPQLMTILLEYQGIRTVSQFLRHSRESFLSSIGYTSHARKLLQTTPHLHSRVSVVTQHTYCKLASHITFLIAHNFHSWCCFSVGVCPVWWVRRWLGVVIRNAMHATWAAGILLFWKWRHEVFVWCFRIRIAT